METKKSKSVDLESRKGLFLEVGFAVALAAVFVAFEWSSSEPARVVYLPEAAEVNCIEELPPITMDKVLPPPPPPPAPADVIEIVPDDDVVDDANSVISCEAYADTEVPFFTEPEAPAPPEEDNFDEPFIMCEQMPVFPGGEEALRSFLANNVHYPAIAADNGVVGRVFVSFVISPSGEVTDVHVARGVDPHLDREAVRVVSSLPRWSPGRQRGRAVPVRCTVPINFTLL